MIIETTVVDGNEAKYANGARTDADSDNGAIFTLLRVFGYISVHLTSFEYF